MTDLPGLLLAAGLALAALDLVRSPFGYARAAAQDRALVRGLALTAVVLLAVDPVPAVLVGLGLLGYVRERNLRFLFLTAGLAALWLLGPRLTPYAPLLAAGWLSTLIVESGVAVGVWRRGARARAFAGWHAQRTHYAAAVALVLPFAWTLGLLWPVTTGLFLGVLLLLSSWVAWGAALAALAVVAPATAPYLAGLVGVGVLLLLPRLLWDRAGWLDVLPRGDSLDSVRQRAASWAAILSDLRRSSRRGWLLGHGWTATNVALLRHAARGRLHPDVSGTSHADPLDLVYGSGVLGVLFLLALAARLGPALRLGDPWSAAVVAGAVVSLGSHSLRYPAVGLPWWIACAMVAGRGGG